MRARDGTVNQTGSATASGTYNLQLNFYIGDGTKTFTVNWGSISQTTNDDGPWILQKI
jgi:hypothetical protein